MIEWNWDKLSCGGMSQKYFVTNDGNLAPARLTW